MFDIDLVVPFVDPTDAVGRKTFIDYLGPKFPVDNSRFDHPDLFRFFIAGVDKFMPGIRNIFLIVSNIEQVPDYINKEKTKIILHKDIIPEKYLPTFNSTVIELFIPFIEGLSEHFIYSNDDMYPINVLQPSDFFTDAGLPRIKFKCVPYEEEMTQFQQVCDNNYKLISKICDVHLNIDGFLRPEHSMVALRLSDCKKCSELTKEVTYAKITAMRTSKQYNQYIYSLYQRFSGNYEGGGHKFMYRKLTNNIDDILDIIGNQKAQIFCLNGANDNAVEAEKINLIKKYFERILNE